MNEYGETEYRGRHNYILQWVTEDVIEHIFIKSKKKKNKGFDKKQIVNIKRNDQLLREKGFQTYEEATIDKGHTENNRSPMLWI